MPRTADARDGLTLLHPLSNLHQNLRIMTVNSLVSATMIQEDGFAQPPPPACRLDGTTLCRFDQTACGSGNVAAVSGRTGVYSFKELFEKRIDPICLMRSNELKLLIITDANRCCAVVNYSIGSHH